MKEMLINEHTRPWPGTGSSVTSLNFNIGTGRAISLFAVVV